jgi:hypothetical protein
LKREIDAGYPVMLILQNPGQLYRDLPGMPHANPDIHAMLAYGYLEDTDGTQFVWYRTSWGDGENHGSLWAPQIWEARMTLRGVITYHPAPKFTSITRTADGVLLKWDGPASVLTDNASGTTWAANWYLLERADSLGGEFVPTGPATAAQEIKIAPGSGNAAFYRLRVLTPGEAGQPQG